MAALHEDLRRTALMASERDDPNIILSTKGALVIAGLLEDAWSLGGESLRRAFATRDPSYADLYMATRRGQGI